jgi:hypothetical protein
MLPYLWFIMLVDIFLLIMGYFLFRLIFNLVLPIVRATRMVRSQFAQTQEDIRRGQTGATSGPKSGGRPPHANPGGAGTGPTPNWDKMGDYIDFEEVK